MLDLGGKRLCNPCGPQAFEEALLLLFELAVVLSHEGLDFTCHGKELFPLLLIV
jgi:hypothetical protein